MAIISVIVPIYNAEKYIEKSINSLLNQTLTDIEIILVNDGSTDNSLKICYELQNKDNRIKVFSQNNQGVSSARNLGISKSNGEYISFFDADDFVMPDIFQTLLNDLLNNNVDMSSVSYFVTKKDSLIIVYDKPNIKIMNQDDSLKELLSYSSISNVSVAKLFKKSIIDNNNIKFPLDYAIAEDRYFIFKYLLHCQRVCCNSVRKYNYVYRKNSAMHSHYSMKNLSSLYVGEDILKMVSKNKPSLIEYAKMSCYIEKVFNLKLMIKDGKMDTKIKPFYLKILNDLKKHNYTKDKFWKCLPFKKNSSTF